MTTYPAERPARTRSGVPITDELIERWTDEAEAGYDLDRLVPQDPSLPLFARHEDELRVPVLHELRDQLRARAEAEGVTEIELARRVLAEFLHRAS